MGYREQILPVPAGGTGDASFTAYSVVCGGTTSTGNLQNVSGVGTTGQVLISNGAAALPTWQAASASGAITTITGDSGGAEVPTAGGNFNILGSGSITTAGSANTETVQLTGLTNHNVLIGAGTSTITKVAPSATSGVPLVSAGAAADPTFGTAVVAGGGTGDTSFTAYSVICGGTTSTGNLQNVVGVGSSGQVLTSNGAAALPTWQSAAASGAILTITGNSGGAEVPTAGGNFNILGTGSITVAGTTNTETVQLTGLTNHNVLIGAGTATITNVAPSATSGIPLVSNGSGSDPSFTTAVVAGGGTGRTTLTNHGVLVGAGTSAITQLSVGTNGQVLLGATSADPAFATLTSTGGSLTYTTGANSLNIDIANFVNVTSWTPGIAFGGGSTGVTYTTQTGLYVRIGNLVMFNFQITLSSKGSSTGNATITGLPVTSGSTGFVGSIPCAHFDNGTFTGTPYFLMNTSTTTMQILLSATGSDVTAVTNTNVANNSKFGTTGFYIIG